MTAEEYRAILSQLGLPQTGAAKLFGVAEVTSRRWAGATSTPIPVPPDIALALSIMAARGIDPRQLEPAGALVQILRLMKRYSIPPGEALELIGEE